MNLKKIVCAALVIAAVFTGCSKKEQAQTTKDGKTVIRASVWDGKTSAYYSELIASFEASHPDIKIDLLDTPSADYTQKLSVMLNGGGDLDVFWIKDGDTTKGLFERGQLADLSEYVQKDGIDLAVYNGLAERFWLEGKNGPELAALPASTAYYVLFYNKDLFDKAGEPYPSNDMTWAQYEQLANRLTSGSGTSKVWGSFIHTWPACVQNWAVQDGKHTIVDTDYSFFKPYYEMVLRMQDAGVIMKFGNLKAGSIAYAIFGQGNIATMPMGFWFASTIKERIEKGEIANIRWAVATLPHPEDVPAGWTVGSVTPICIAQVSKKKDAAWEFVKYITGEEAAQIYAKHAVFSSRATAEDLAILAQTPGMPDGLVEALAVKNIALDRPMDTYVAPVNQMLTEEHGLIMLGEVSIDKGLANMSKRSKEIQGKK